MEVKKGVRAEEYTVIKIAWYAAAIRDMYVAAQLF